MFGFSSYSPLTAVIWGWTAFIYNHDVMRRCHHAVTARKRVRKLTAMVWGGRVGIANLGRVIVWLARHEDVERGGQGKERLRRSQSQGIMLDSEKRTDKIDSKCDNNTGGEMIHQRWRRRVRWQLSPSIALRETGDMECSCGKNPEPGDDRILGITVSICINFDSAYYIFLSSHFVVEGKE